MCDAHTHTYTHTYTHLHTYTPTRTYTHLHAHTHSYGELPYKAVKNREVQKAVVGGLRLEQPADGPEPLYRIARSCWRVVRGCRGKTKRRERDRQTERDRGTERYKRGLLSNTHIHTRTRVHVRDIQDPEKRYKFTEMQQQLETLYKESSSKYEDVRDVGSTISSM